MPNVQTQTDDSLIRLWPGLARPPTPGCKVESGLDGHVFGLQLPGIGRARMGSA